MPYLSVGYDKGSPKPFVCCSFGGAEQLAEGKAHQRQGEKTACLAGRLLACRHTCTLDRPCQHRSCQDWPLSQHESCQKKACPPGQIDCTSAKKGGSFLSRAARIRSRSASTATLLRTMMTQSSRQSEILSVPARPFVQHRMVCLVPLICFLTKAQAASLEKVILLSSGIRRKGAM